MLTSLNEIPPFPPHMTISMPSLDGNTNANVGLKLPFHSRTESRKSSSDDNTHVILELKRGCHSRMKTFMASLDENHPVVFSLTLTNVILLMFLSPIARLLILESTHRVIKFAVKLVTFISTVISVVTHNNGINTYSCDRMIDITVLFTCIIYILASLCSI